MNKSMEPTMAMPTSPPHQPQIIPTTSSAPVVKPAVNGVNTTPQIVPPSTSTSTVTSETTASTILSTSTISSNNVPDVKVLRRDIKSAMVMEPVRKEKVPPTSSVTTTTTTISTSSSAVPNVGVTSTSSTTTTTNSSSSLSSSIPVTTSAATTAPNNINSSTNANSVTVGPTITTTTTTANTTAANKESNTSQVSGKDEKSVENSNNSNSKMEPRNQIILNPLKPNTSSSVNKSLPQDVNNSSNQSNFSSTTNNNKSKAPEPAPLGKDVTTVIGRIEQVRGLTSSSQVSALADGPTPSPRSVVAGKGVNSSIGEKPERPPRTPAHDSGSSVEATPKTPNQRIRARTTSARAASASAFGSGPAKSTLSSHRVSTTVSTKSFAEASQNNNVRNKSERPATSFTRPTTSSTFKGISNYSPSTTLKTNRSYSAIRTHQKMGDAAGDATPAVVATTGEKAAEKPTNTLKEQFAAFCRFGDTSSDGKSISLSNSDKWLKQAKIIDGKKITTTDTSISFKKLFKTAKKVNFEDFKKYIEDLATSKKIEVNEIHDKLINCGPPGLSTATKATSKGVVERLTDTSKYTGSHKERFDASGKGKGIEGRRDVKDQSGYVQGAKIVPK